MKRTGLIVGAVALVGAGACSNKSQPTDESLKNDLELVSNAQKPQVVVSPLEAGPTSAPAQAAPKRTPKPSPKPVTHVAQRQTPPETPAPQPVRHEPVVEAPAPQPAPQPAQQAPQAEPTPAPAPVRQAPAPNPDRRVYKTEGEIFRQMPWIRP